MRRFVFWQRLSEPTKPLRDLSLKEPSFSPIAVWGSRSSLDSNKGTSFYYKVSSYKVFFQSENVITTEVLRESSTSAATKISMKQEESCYSDTFACYCDTFWQNTMVIDFSG
jgi:hypothetical protein